MSTPINMEIIPIPTQTPAPAPAPSEIEDQNKQEEKLSPEIEYDRYFLEWLKEVKHSIIVTSYKTSYIFNIGYARLLKPEQREQLSFWMTQSVRCMGATKANNGKDIWIGNMSYLTKYVLFGEQQDEGDNYKRDPFDGHYIPRKLHITNDIDMHDIVVPTKGINAGVPHFISAVYGCVCIPSESASFKVHWCPPWISKIAAEDRCHLNGLCCVNGEPRYVTAIARTDVRGGWREHKKDGGVIFDIVNNALVSKKLSMPHSPRWHNGKLWLLNSGKGEFGYVDFSTTKSDDGEEYYPFVAKCFIPGYLRGLDFVDTRYAVIGSSDDRHDQTFQELELGTKLKELDVQSKCGIHIVDLKTFDIIHEMKFSKPITELYDVVTIPRIVRPLLEELHPMQLSRKISVEE